jgi:signal transduction histidine kinase
MVKHSLTEARRALWDLRSNVNADLPLTLSETLRQLGTGKKVGINFVVDGVPQKLPEDIQTNVLRIGQEAVSNALNYAEADKIEVKLSFAETKIRLEVEDDGRGFDVHQSNSNGFGHFGLIGMRERAKKLGGKFDLQSNIGEGTKICVEIPLAKTK